MTLHIKEKGAILKRKKRESSDDDGSDSYESIKDEESKRTSKLNRSRVKASVPLNQPEQPQNGVRSKVTGALLKVKELWSQCCHKHFPPISRDIPMVETNNAS